MTRVEEIVKRYHDDNDTLGYDQAIAMLEALGLWAADADKLLHPSKDGKASSKYFKS